MGTGKIVELLAPAKDYAHGCAAIDCGADARYVGAPAFGARAGAAVPADEIGRLCDYAHRFGAKVFVTMNTLVYESELSEAERIARDMYRAGADALIVQDAAFLRMDLPPIELHASTQMFNMDPVRARFWYEAGFTRLIVERAASLDEMRRIAGAAPGLEIEAFVHGAICVCYSGRCFMSRSMGPRSGNRGDCSQACRLPYELLDGRMRSQGRARHWLSVRDLNLSDRLEEMIDAGVGSFKIEGRLKDMAYVRNVVGWYRSRLDEIFFRRPDLKRASQGSVALDFEPDPAKSFSRGSTHYFLDGPAAGVASLDTPKSLGEAVGTVVSAGREWFGMSGKIALAPGDGICFADETGELRGTYVNRTEDGRVYPNRMDGIGCGTAIFRNYDRRFSGALERSRSRRTLPVEAAVEVTRNRISVTFSDGSSQATASRDGRFDEALDPLRAERTVRAQTAKTGDTSYEVCRIEVRWDMPRFVPVSLLNELRREALSRLDAGRAACYVRRSRREENLRALFPDTELSAEENVVNSLAAGFYREHGVRRIEPGFDAGPIPEGCRVMRTRYCLRRETGQCLRKNPVYRGRLFLASGRHVYELLFDCARCEMSVVYRGERGKPAREEGARRERKPGRSRR